MLDDVERRRLSEIDAWFQDTDPRLARRLAGGSARSGRRHRIAVMCVVIAVAGASVGGWLAGPPAAMAAMLTALAVGVGSWLQTRHHPPASPDE